MEGCVGDNRSSDGPELGADGEPAPCLWHGRNGERAVQGMWPPPAGEIDVRASLGTTYPRGLFGDSVQGW